ncbi:hypothetical protein BH10BAC2_BH10BAC2_15650 [soil metagenome]
MASSLRRTIVIYNIDELSTVSTPGFKMRVIQNKFKMKSKQTILVFIALIHVFSFQLLAQNTVIKAGHFFDARSGKMLDNQVIIVHNGKIKEVGPNLKINKTDTVIDLTNSYVLPGLMDCHVHITSNLSYRKRNWNDADVTESNALRAIRGFSCCQTVFRQWFYNH